MHVHCTSFPDNLSLEEGSSSFCNLIKNTYLEAWCAVLHKHCQEAGILVW